MAKHSFHRWLIVCAFVAIAAGCGKRDSSSPPSADTTDQVAISEDYKNITDRSIDYLKGLVARKEYQPAREALKTLESRTLTPAQRKTVNDLKAQIPNP